MLMKTRARKLKERQDSSKKGDSTDYSSIAPDENDQRDLTVTESISKRSAKSKHERETSSEPELEQSIENDRRTVDPEIKRIFVGENQLLGTLPEDAYLRLLNSKFAVKDCVKIMMVIVNYVLRKMGITLTETMLEAEAWRAMIRTSQKLYPAKMRKRSRRK